MKELGFLGRGRWVGAVTIVLLTILGVGEAGAYEVKTDRDGDIVRWEGRSIELCLGAELLERFGVEQATHAAKGAAAAWSGIANAPEIRISVANTRAFDPNRLSNCIHLTREWVSEGNELAFTFSAVDSHGYVRGTDIVLNGRHPFGVVGLPLGDERFDLQAVLTHEMGHLLGLAENPNDDSSTMHPDLGVGETFQRDITDDDRAGVEFIYDADPGVEAAACMLRPTEDRSSSLHFTTLALMIAAARRRRGRIVQSGGH